MKIRPLVAGLFHAGIQKNRHDEANRCFFCNFANLPKNGYVWDTRIYHDSMFI